MIVIEDNAVEHLQNLLNEGGQATAIRIAVMGGPHGPCLGLLKDDPTDEDVSVQERDIPFIIDRKLLDYCRTITIGFIQGRDGVCGGSSGSGFLIASDNSLTI